jgi:hypothetical protein
VDFREGRVTGATIRSNPHPIGQILLRAGKITDDELAEARSIQQRPGERRRLGEILVSIGALTGRELRRQIRRQIEAVVFELMSWQEGFFSFVEGEVAAPPGDPDAGLSTESLLMEAARRIDEWTRIAHVIPGPAVVPALASPAGAQPPVLDLRPNEWQLLSAVDGTSDLRSIAVAAGLGDFEAARIVYGLVTTGVLQVREPAPGARASEDAAMLLSDAREALRRGELPRAIDCWRRVIASDPRSVHAGQAREAIAHATRLQALVEVGDA